MTGEESGSNRPLLLAVDGDFSQLSRIEAELSRSFGADYRVRGELSAEDALRTLQDAGRRNERVAVVLVDEMFSRHRDVDTSVAQDPASERAAGAPAALGCLGPPRDGAEDPPEHGDRRHQLLRAQAVGVRR